MADIPVQDITLYQSSTFEMQVIYEDADGNAITNLSNVQMQIKTLKTDAFAARILGLNNGSGITLTAATGTIDIKITDEQTEAMTPGSAWYDLIVENTSGDRYVLLQGAVTIEQGVTSWQS